MIFRRSLEAFHHMGIRLSLSQLINQRRIEMEFVQEKNLLGHKSGIYSLEVLPNNLFLSGAGDGWIVEWPILADAGEDGALISKVDAQIFDLGRGYEWRHLCSGLRKEIFIKQTGAS